MPLSGSRDIRPLLEGAPTVTLGTRELRIDDVDVLQVLFETRAANAEALLPAALNPTIPPVISFLAIRAEDSEVGPFSLVQLRLTARAAVRPRAFLVAARCDNATAAELLANVWGFRIDQADIALRRFHDRVECRVVADRRPILEVALVDPWPITGHDVQYAPGMHLARVEDDAASIPRLVQVDAEYEFRRADRGRPELRTFDPGAWGDERLVAVEPVSASFTACSMSLLPIRYVCNPDLPAAEGTVQVGA